MGTQVWCFVASIVLVIVKGELSDNISQSFYEKPQSSSPAPLLSSTPFGGQLAGMKELVLYLTPEQAQVLQAAGAIVKPFPQFENAFLQQKYQQSLDDNTESQYQPATSLENQKQDMELDEFYKLVNIQQINEDLSLRQQPTEEATEKPRPKYKYNSKLRQQEYAATYVPKKANRGKSSTEYVRYLPNYEIEELKMEPFQPKPIPGYQFGNLPSIEEQFPTYFHPEVSEIQKPQQNQNTEEIQPIEDISTRTFGIQQTETQQPVESVQDQPKLENKGPVTFEEKVKTDADVRTNTQANINKYEEIQTAQSPLAILPVDSEPSVKEQETQPVSNPAPISDIVQRQYTSLLAPLIQHEKITESIAQQKEELENNEHEIQKNLQQIKESGNPDEEKYAIELDKLNNNLGRQNALAAKLVLDSIAKKPKPQVLFKEEVPVKSRRPVEILKNIKAHAPSRVLVQVPQPLAVRALQPYSGPRKIRPIPIPVLIDQSEKRKPIPVPVEQPIPIPVITKPYVNTGKSYLLQRVPTVDSRHEFPVQFPIQSDDFTILRELWEH